MPNRLHAFVRYVVSAAAILMATGAQASDWSIQKASGPVWVVSAKVQRASLGQERLLSAGDTLQTGPNGRVLLVRGDETILVGPNTVISLPPAASNSAFTTILQQAGSIAVKADKRDVQHFEVQTPYLAAVVKGTEFTVTLEPEVADVQVTSGEVEVSDFKSGQTASVMRGQAARCENGLGLILRGDGVFKLIRNSEPVKAVLWLVNVPKGGLRAPIAKSGQMVKSVALQVGNSLKQVSRAAQSFPSILDSIAFWSPPKRRTRQ